MRRRLVIAIGLLATCIAVALAWNSCRSTRDGSGWMTTPGRPTPLASGRDPPADLRVQARASIAGKVTDERGAPVANARVCAHGYSEELPRSHTLTPTCTQTDERGAYRIENLIPIAYEVTAMARPHRPAYYRSGWGGLDLRPGEQKVGIDLVLRDGGVEITGIVVDINGGPVAQALVHSMDNGPMVESDDAGRFALWVAPGGVDLWAEADGYVRGEQRGTAPGAFEIVMTPGSSIAGTIVDATTNMPVAGIPVRAATEEQADWPGPPGDISDNEGRFRIDRLEPDRYMVIARGARSFGSSEGSTLLGLAQQVDGVVVKVFPAVSIAGRVVIAGDAGAVCTDPRVRLTPPGIYESVRSRGDVDGSIHIDGVLPGTYDVDVFCRGFAAREKYPRLTVTDVDQLDLTWEVDRGGTVRGRVLLRSGAAVAGAWVSGGDSAMDVSDPDGTYELTGLTAGKRTSIGVSSDVGIKPDGGFDTTPREGEIIKKDLVLEEAGGVHGIVVDAAGNPIAGAEVLITANISGEHAGGARRTGGDGNFTVAPLPTGEYGVRVLRSGTELRMTREMRVNVRAPETVSIRIVVEGQTRSIRGTVSDGAGAAVTDAFVVAAREDETDGRYTREAMRWSWRYEPVVTGLDGSFAVTGLGAGAYTVRAFRRGGGEGTLEHVPVDATVTLEIRPTGVIEGTVGGASDVLFVNAFDASKQLSRDERFFRTGGRYSVNKDLPAGHYTITVYTGQRRGQSSVDLADGEHERADIDLDGGVTFTGRVVDLLTKEPVTGVVIWTSLGGEGHTSPAFVRPDIVQATTDTAGRFAIPHVPIGAVFVLGGGTNGYGSVKVIRRNDGTRDIDLGDLHIVKSRAKDRDDVGELGITWRELPYDTPSEQQSFEVIAIDPTGPAARTALRVGDVVTTIDGLDVVGNNHWAGATMLYAPAGTRIQLGLARGVSVTVVAAPP